MEFGTIHGLRRLLGILEHAPHNKGDNSSEQFILWASHSVDQGTTLPQSLLSTCTHSSLNRKKSERMR